MAKRWYSTAAACEQLGLSSRTLYRMRERGELKKGEHWKVTNPNARRLTYQYLVAAIVQLQSEVITEAPTNQPLKGDQLALTPEAEPCKIVNER